MISVKLEVESKMLPEPMLVTDKKSETRTSEFKTLYEILTHERWEQIQVLLEN